jgi:hypothetical protein
MERYRGNLKKQKRVPAGHLGDNNLVRLSLRVNIKQIEGAPVLLFPVLGYQIENKCNSSTFELIVVT